MFVARLARRVVAQAMGERVDPAERPLGAADVAQRTALAVNNSNSATGSGLDHSPCVHALYQPTEPEVASRTSAIQLVDVGRSRSGPGARKPRSRCVPSGSVASIPPFRAGRRSGRATLRERRRGQARDQRRRRSRSRGPPAPDARRACSWRRVMNSGARLSSADDERRRQRQLLPAPVAIAGPSP